MVEMFVSKNNIIKCQAMHLDIIAHIGLLLCSWIYDDTLLTRLIDEQISVRRHRYIVELQNLDIIAEYKTQKEALIAIGQEGKSGIGDALRGRNKTHNAYGFAWCFKDEYDDFVASREQ